MARQLDAVYEQGVLRPLEPLVLPEHQHVRVTIEEQPAVAKSANGAPIQENPITLSGKSTEAANEWREEMQWLARESAPYAGEWVAIQGLRLIAHGAKLADVSAAATAAGVMDPFFASVPEDMDISFAGW
jgi:predicted DNA-binding antitoxin AbrB/MazE fold protein